MSRIVQRNTRPIRRATVSRSSILVPARSARFRKKPCRLTVRREPTVRRTTLNGQRRPVQRSSIAVLAANRLGVNLTLLVLEPAASHAVRTAPMTGGNGSLRPSQFSSTSLPISSGSAGADRGDGVVAILRARRAVAVAVGLGGVAAGAVLVDPVVGDVGGARADRGLGVVAVGGPPDAVAVGVALDLLTRDPGVGVVGDRGVVAAAAVDPLGAAVTGDDVVVLRAAVEHVGPAAAEQPVVPSPPSK